MRKFSALVLLAFCLFGETTSAFAASPETIRQIIQNVVGLQRGEGCRRYRRAIDIEYVKQDIVNAYAQYDYEKGGIQIGFSDEILRILNEDEVVLVVCHELGHLVGHLTPSDVGVKSSGKPDPLSLEGEADYFAGKCAVTYYMDIEGLDEAGAQEKTFSAVESSFSKLYGVPVHARAARRVAYRHGVNLEYPFPNCRALSTWNGAEGLPRPKCWYNPRPDRKVQARKP